MNEVVPMRCSVKGCKASADYALSLDGRASKNVCMPHMRTLSREATVVIAAYLHAIKGW
jgi:hypothetical protein